MAAEEIDYEDLIAYLRKQPGGNHFEVLIDIVKYCADKGYGPTCRGSVADRAFDVLSDMGMFDFKLIATKGIWKIKRQTS